MNVKNIISFASPMTLAFACAMVSYAVSDGFAGGSHPPKIRQTPHKHSAFGFDRDILEWNVPEGALL